MQITVEVSRNVVTVEIDNPARPLDEYTARNIAVVVAAAGAAMRALHAAPDDDQGDDIDQGDGAEQDPAPGESLPVPIPGEPTPSDGAPAPGNERVFTDGRVLSHV